MLESVSYTLLEFGSFVLTGVDLRFFQFLRCFVRFVAVSEMTISQKSKILEHLNFKMRAILCDSRTFVGTMIAFDKHMNLMFTDCIEYKKYKPRRKKEFIEEKRTLGFVLLRGENIVSLVVESPPESRSRSSSPSRSESGRSGSSVRS